MSQCSNVPPMSIYHETDLYYCVLPHNNKCYDIPYDYNDNFVLIYIKADNLFIFHNESQCFQ